MFTIDPGLVDSLLVSASISHLHCYPLSEETTESNQERREELSQGSCREKVNSTRNGRIKSLKEIESWSQVMAQWNAFAL